jgi:hypothetical protein
MPKGQTVIHALNVARMESMLLQQIPWSEIVAEFIGTGAVTAESTLRDWRREIWQRWAADDADLRPHRRDVHREMLRALYHEALKDKAWGACERVLKQLMILDGLQTPDTLNINHTHVPVEKMSPEEREREIAELIAKRNKAQAEFVKPRSEPS